MQKFEWRVRNKKYDIHYQPAPRFGDYDAIRFIILSSERKRFTYLIKIDGVLKAMLIKQEKVTPEDYQEAISKAFIEYVKSRLDKGYEKNIEFMFTSDRQNLFEKFFGKAGKMPRKGSFQVQEWAVLKYLYDIHYQVFNTDDTPVSLRIIFKDMAIDKQRTLDILKSLKAEDKIELVGRDINDTFARIIPKGIKAVESK